MRVNLDTAGLLKWARRFDDEIPRKTPIAIAKAINAVGETVVAKVASKLANDTGLDESDIRSFIFVTEATPNNLVWAMDASQVAPPSMNWERPWSKTKGETSSGFDSGIIVKIITMDDEKVCKICEDASENGPYTLEEAQKMLPLHPNCRCLINSWSNKRRLPVTFGKGGSAPTQLFTSGSLAKAISGEVKIVLRSKSS